MNTKVRKSSHFLFSCMLLFMVNPIEASGQEPLIEKAWKPIPSKEILIASASNYTIGLRKCATAEEMQETFWCSLMPDKTVKTTDFCVLYWIFIGDPQDKDQYTWKYWYPDNYTETANRETTWTFYVDPELGCCFKAMSQTIYGCSAYLAAGPGVGNSVHTGTWRVKIYRNGNEVAQDCFTLVEGGFADRDQAKTDLDERWNNLTLAGKESAVSNLFKFNDFLNGSSHVSSREIDSAITKAKAQYPIYANFDAKLITSIIICESMPTGNYFSISPTGALGIGQEIPYIDVNLRVNKDQPSPIYAHKKFETLQKSGKADQDMHTFKTETFNDNRTLVVESIAIMFAHLSEIKNCSYIGSDIKKMLAGYKWGQGYLKEWLDSCERKSIDWYESLDKAPNNEPLNRERADTRIYIDRVLSYYR